jgi:hypothetical protein
VLPLVLTGTAWLMMPGPAAWSRVALAWSRLTRRPGPLNEPRHLVNEPRHPVNEPATFSMPGRSMRHRGSGRPSRSARYGRGDEHVEDGIASGGDSSPLPPHLSPQLSAIRPGVHLFVRTTVVASHLICEGGREA